MFSRYSLNPCAAQLAAGKQETGYNDRIVVFPEKE
jgi:hypothetical protein